MATPLEFIGREIVPVTVVVPVYNRSELLVEALRSVAAQTVQPREIVVVDDGSTDDSAAVAERMGARVIRRANGGVSSARNVGTEEARTRWVAYLDSDDLWLPRKLELQYQAVSEHGECGAVVTDFRIFTPGGVFDESAFELNREFTTIRKRNYAPMVSELISPSAGQVLARSMFAQPSCLLVDRHVAIGIGGFDETMSRCEDHEFALRLFAATRVIAIGHPLVRYRVHPLGLSKNDVDMRLAAVSVADRVISRASLYPPGADAVMLAERPALLRRAAAALIKRGDVRAARGLLGNALMQGFDSKVAGMFVASCFAPDHLPEKERRRLLDLWRRRPWRRPEDWQQSALASTADFSGTNEAAHPLQVRELESVER